MSTQPNLFDLIDHAQGYNVEDALDTLVNYESALKMAVAETVAKARAQGVTWERVGAILGVSKQAAQQKYGSS